MGKCASKQPVSGLNEFGSSPYLAICSDDDIIFINVGQSESKKSSKKAAGLETKGTAMSFGFKKHKIHQSTAASKLPKAAGGDGTGPGSGTGTLKKTQTAASNNGNHLYGGLEKEKATERDNATVISNPGVDGIFSDKNGNMAGSADQPDDDTTKATGRSTPRLQPPKKDSHGAPYRNNRFGFRTTNVVRPASAGLQPKTISDYDKQHSNNNNNIHTTNNNNVYITDKRRSKSASAAASARTTFTPLQQAPTQVQQERSSALQHPTGYGGALHKPQPKYQSAHGATKIATSESGAQQVMTKCDQAEHKNTSHNLPSAITGATAAPSGSTDEHRSQSSVNNTNARQCVSANDSNQQHAAAQSLIKPPQEPSSVAKFTLHSSSLPKPQYPVPISLPSATPHYVMDPKGAKQAANVCRKGILHQYQREPSSDRMFDRDQDSNPDVDTASNIRMPRQRYRNLEMILHGRHKFEVRDLETLTAEPIVSLALPQLPSAFNSVGHQQQPIPLSGLVRSSELPRQLSDDIDINDNRYEPPELVDPIERKDSIASSDVESFEEEKLARDNNSSEKSLKGALINDSIDSHCSKTSSPGSSRASWCNAGESMAAKECSSLSLSSSDESNVLRNRAGAKPMAVDEEDVSSVTITAGNPSLLSSFSAPIPMDISINLDSVSEVQNSFNDNTLSDQPDSNRIFRSEEYKFAEIAAAVGDAILLDDETSPTDSLVSSCTESDDVRKNRKKPVEGKPEEKEKDIDEISPELEEISSPITPGTPTHASNSLSLSDGGRDFLIDDEIADQPALVFDEPTLNENSMIDLESINLNIKEDTPTLRDSISSLNNNNNNSINNRSLSHSVPPVPRPRKIMAATYESPASIRKNRTRLSRAESLDTLSPCDSIASDDYMLDFNSSMDSIDRPPRSNASGSASALHSMDELQLWSELENKGGQLVNEWSKLLRSQRNSNNNTSRESITSLLPARATRLLTRRLQNNATPTNCGTGGSDSPRSMDSLPRRTALSASYKTATLNQFNNNTDSASTATNSAEDLTLLDKSLRNSMMQDVVHFKKQLVRLRRMLQEDEENLMMTDTLNPFENNNGQFFTTATTTTQTTTASSTTTGAAGEAGAIATSVVDSKQQENTLIKLEDQRQELADLRRQVVYLQGEITTRDHTIRKQQNQIKQYEAELEKLQAGLPVAADRAAGNGTEDKTIDTISTATQTERLRPLSFGGQEGLASRSEPASPLQAPTLRNGLRSPANANSSNHHHHANGGHSTTSPSSSSSALINSNGSRGAVNHKPKTQISSVYTQLSSIKHSNHHHHHQHHGSSSTMGQKRSSLGSNSNLNHIASSAPPSPSNNAAANGAPMKTVRTTLIGNVLTSSKLNQSNSSVSPPPLPPSNGTKLLKTSIRTQMTGGNGLITSHKQSTAPPSSKRSSAIKPPSSFANSTFPADSHTAHKSKSAPPTPMTERVPATPSSPLATPNVQIVIETVESKENGFSHEQQNGGSSPKAGADASDSNNNNGNGKKHDDDDDKEQIAETEKDAINNKINSLKLANGLTGCNDSNCKETSLVI